MTQRLMPLSHLAHQVSPWRLPRWLLVCGLLVLVCWPKLSPAASCGSTSFAMFKDDGTAMPTNIYYRTDTVGITFFSGYILYKLRNCPSTGGTLAYISSGLVTGNILDTAKGANIGTDITNTTITPINPSGFAVTCPATLVRTQTTYALSTTLSGWNCDYKFSFTLSTNSSMTGNNISKITVDAGAAISSGSVVGKAWAITQGQITNPGLLSTSTYVFSPIGCSLTTAAPSVNLGGSSRTSLTSDSTANWTTFNLGFSNCINPDTNYGIAVTFNYTSFDASNPNLIANSASTGAASNAGVQLALNDGTTIASGTLYTVLANTTNGVTGYTVPLKARMRAATGKTPTAGKVTATATFTVTYQ